MTTPDDLVAQIHAFLADAPKGQLHTGYRYGELLEQAAARIVELELRRDVISDVQNKQLRHAEAELADRRSHDAERQQEWFVTQRRAECAEADGKAAFGLSVECRARAVKAEAENDKLREALRELVECKDLGIAATRKLHEDAGSIQHGRIMNEEAKQMDAEYSRRIGPAWDAARAALEQP